MPVLDPTLALEHMLFLTPNVVGRPRPIKATYEPVFSLYEVDVTRKAVFKLPRTHFGFEVTEDDFVRLLFWTTLSKKFLRRRTRTSSAASP